MNTMQANQRLFDVLMKDDIVKRSFNCTVTSLSKKLKLEFRTHLAIKQAMLCHYCKNPMTLHHSSKGKRPDNFASFEHLIDIFVTGKKDNHCSKIVLACAKCNSERGTDRAKQALCYYGGFFLNRCTIHELIRHVGWKRIIESFGPLPNI